MRRASIALEGIELDGAPVAGDCLVVSAEVRQGIVAAVGEWGGSAVSPWLRERLAEDPAPGVRAEAAYRLGILSDSDARAALESTTAKDPDSGVRRWAKRGS